MGVVDKLDVYFFCLLYIALIFANFLIKLLHQHRWPYGVGLHKQVEYKSWILGNVIVMFSRFYCNLLHPRWFRWFSGFVLAELWNFRPHVLSLPRANVPSLPGTFAPCNNMYRSLELSPPYQYKKRIRRSQHKKCSSLLINVALHSVLASRHVRVIYDAGWHGIGKDYEVILIERIDKMRLSLTRTSVRLYYVLIYQ